jgi:A/G-specific adenine glycosylase
MDRHQLAGQTVKSAALKSFHTRLHEWYAQHGRKDLPWRKTRDPYAIYISEIMLQQTQVATVLERYYFPFLKRFPTLSALASAPQDAVLSAWQGLGYYNRAINLHKAAKACGGMLPDTVEALHSLPGVGRNTAHAVAAFAYHQPLAVMEANVKRVLSRIFALSAPREEELWEKAHALLDRRTPFDYNQAMMDIGATICRKRAPLCSECPANGICAGKATPESYPAPKAKKTVPVRQKHIYVLQNDEGKYFATLRKTRFLNGLYHFVEIDSSSRRKPGSSKAPWARHSTIRAADAAHWIPASTGMTYVDRICQQYSHFTLEAEVYLVEIKSSEGKHWYSLPQLKKLPVSMAEKKILALLDES